MDSLISKTSSLKLSGQLLILDMNGLLVYREYCSDRTKKPPKNCVKAGNFFIGKRPGLSEFLKYIFNNYNVAVWSSASKRNVANLIDIVFTKVQRQKLIFIWDQSHCEKKPHPESSVKPLFTKPLVKVWKSFENYSRENTFIIDDSALKNECNPKNCVFLVDSWEKNMEKASLVELIKKHFL